MLEWHTPHLEDRTWASLAVSDAGLGSDLAFANIYLLRNKYDTRICQACGSLLRAYSGHGSRRGFAFPAGGDWAAALGELAHDAKEHGQPMEFCFLTEENKDRLEAAFPGRFHFAQNDGDSDYVYARDDLANLKGRAFQKKRNRFSKFMRTCPDAEFRPITAQNRADAIRVAEQWYAEQDAADASLLAERAALTEALTRFDELGLRGGVLYIYGAPAAMTAGSPINAAAFDIHFEKALRAPANDGAYSAINKMFAATLDCAWINREEDLGDEGLRQAKLAYNPKIILQKYSAKEI